MSQKDDSNAVLLAKDSYGLIISDDASKRLEHGCKPSEQTVLAVVGL
jgi:hypothetical protein